MGPHGGDGCPAAANNRRMSGNRGPQSELGIRIEVDFETEIGINARALEGITGITNPTSATRPSKWPISQPKGSVTRCMLVPGGGNAVKGACSADLPY